MGEHDLRPGLGSADEEVAGGRHAAGDLDHFFRADDPPLTAAFIGAGYAAGCVLVVLCLRDPVWAHNRVPVLTVESVTGSLN